MAYAAKRHGKRIHSVAQEGNHYHLVLTDPTSSGLVEKVALWPGLVTLPEHFDGWVFRARRPEFFFDPEGKMPEEVELVIEPPTSSVR